MSGPKPTPRSSGAQIDGTLLARMIGRAGDPNTIREKGAALAAALSETLAERLTRVTGTAIGVDRPEVRLGLRSTLLAGIGASDIGSDAVLKDWCSDIGLVTTSAAAVAFAERMLGGIGEGASDRALSPIEQDITIVLFEQALEALAKTVGKADGQYSAGRPAAGGVADAADGSDHCVMITVQLGFAGIGGPLRLILPQETVLKTEIVAPEGPAALAPDVAPEWIERLNRQVSRSDVKLTGYIRLATLTLGDLARLKAGDVLPFADEKDVSVRLDANGRELGWCELGRTGNRYMLRLKPSGNVAGPAQA